jgi:hypothetical protein
MEQSRDLVFPYVLQHLPRRDHIEYRRQFVIEHLKRPRNIACHKMSWDHSPLRSLAAQRIITAVQADCPMTPQKEVQHKPAACTSQV